jgi:hypothetical protein
MRAACLDLRGSVRPGAVSSACVGLWVSIQARASRATGILARMAEVPIGGIGKVRPVRCLGDGAAVAGRHATLHVPTLQTSLP